MINERCGEFIFRTSLVQVAKFHTHTDGSFLFIHGNWVGYPFGLGNQVDEANIKKLLHLFLNNRGLSRIYIFEMLSNMFSIWISPNLMLDNRGVNPWHLFV
jgi:hypothetical protein